MRIRGIKDFPEEDHAPAVDETPAPAADAEEAEEPTEGEPRGYERSSSRFALKNWRVGWRLIALIAIPTITAIGFGAVRIAQSTRAAEADQRVEALANLGSSVTNLANALEDERDSVAGYVAKGRPGGSALTALQHQYAATNREATLVRSGAAGIGTSYTPQVRNDVTAVLDRLNDVKYFRSAATQTKVPALQIIGDYSAAIGDMFTLNNQIAQGVNDPTLSNSVSALGALSRAEDQASQQRGILYSALLAHQFVPGAASSLATAHSAQTAEFAEFQSASSLAEQQFYSDTVAGPPVDQASAMELQALNSSAANNGNFTVTAPAPFTDPANAWNSTMSATLSKMRTVEQGLVNSIITQSHALHASATRSVLQTGLIVLIVLIVVLMITIVVARSMVRPLRKLRTGALEVAGLRLPETVRRMSESDGEGVSLDVEPIDVDSSDEIGEVARAFDQVHREALRLAANEAALRGNVNAMFVNLSRRSQSLVERQISLIDDLEQGEQDPERLSSLFQMDHLATRMRRNSENLLVLAGHDETRRWNQSVALVDVLRAALSEIEQYERVTLNVQPGIAARGQAVSDVVHLTAELIENATSFSAADTPVTIAGHLLSSGGVLLEITDQGVGMGAEEMAHANWRLDNPPVVDVAVSRRMGLFVVARLAARHGIRVRLRPAATGGLIALVWLPDEAILHESPDALPGVGHIGVPDEFLSEPGPMAGAGANGAGATSGIWGETTGSRTAAEQEVTAARAPRFAPLRPDAEDTGPGLGPRRVPGAGPRPGGWANTGPLPMFRTVPRPAGADSEFEATGTQPPAGADGDAALEPAAAAAGPDAPTAAFTPFGTGPQPGSDVEADAPLGTDPEPILGAPSALASADGDVSSPLDGLGAWDLNSARGVIVPSADSLGEESRLPIFEAVESDWFRRGRQSVGRSGSDGDGENGNGWASPADEGWRAAEAVSAPSSGGLTPAGLPKRVPKANLVPGTAAAVAAAASGPSPAPTPALAPARSAAATRDRFASFQRGVKQGRAAAGAQEPESGDEEESSDEG
ncbi:MAG TPA: nitrate- and nitrite sensing domain-containing protein [Streptosporangiaceae bacterium]